MSKLCDYIDSVIDNRGKNPDKYYSIEKYPVIDNYLIKNTIYPNMSDVNRYINQEEYNNFLRCYIRKDEVLMTLVGNGYGNVTLAPSDNVAIIQNTIGFRTNNNLNSIFLFYYLQYISKSIKALDRGSSQPSLKVSDILDLNVNIPDIKKQILISNALQTIDLKIENNNKIISTLESLAKTIYDYWFLQFEFPNEDGKPYKSSGGKMVWNEELKREIPEGWEVFMVKDFCDIFTGKKDVNQALDTGKYKFFSCAPGYKYSNDKLYTGKAILISGNGSYTGRTIFVNDSFDLYQRTYACVMKPNYDNMLEYIFYTMKTFFVKRVSGGTHGSAIPYIVYNDIANEHFYYNKEVVERFMEIVVPIQEQIIELAKENQELASLRDFLLPLLMNGQVTFKEEL